MFNTSKVAAVNTNVTMEPNKDFVKAELESVTMDDKGNLDFNFKGATGTFKKKEFKIDPTDPRYKEEYAEATLQRITHIFTAFVSKEELDAISEPTFEAWAKRAIALLGSRHVGKEVTLKLVYSKKNFTDFPYFPNFISSAFRPCELKTNPKYDSYEKYPEETPDAEAKATPTDQPQTPDTIAAF